MTTQAAGRRRRWVYNKASLSLLLVLQPLCLIVGFVLLTEPCLNVNFKPSLWDKRNYLTIVTLLTHTASRSDWIERFTRAGVKSLFGTAVIQAWFTARITAYIQKAALEERRLISLLKSHRTIEQSEVGSFVRQMESVSASFLVLPFTTAGVYAVLVAVGSPLYTHRKQTLVLATHLALLTILPLTHVLGLPPMPEFTTKTLFTNPPTTTTADKEDTVVINSAKAWEKLLALNARPSYLLPLFYPILGCLAATLLSTAALALDWDVAWQTYPFPHLVGSLIGLMLGNVYTLVLVLFH